MTAAESLLRRLLTEGGEVHEADGYRWCSFKGGGEFDLDRAELMLLRALAAEEDVMGEPPDERHERLLADQDRRRDDLERRLASGEDR